MNAHPAAVLLTLAAACAGCTSHSAPVATGGDAERGRQVIVQTGCGSCHTIPGIHRATGKVGPPLFFWSERAFIAGELPNTPANLVRWIRDPREVEPGTAMPALGLSDEQARDIAAYLYTLH